MTTNTGNKRNDTTASEQHSQAYKRFLHAVVVICVAGLFLLSIQLYSQQQQRWLEHDINEPGDVLARHYAAMLASALTDENDARLRHAVTTLEAEPAVLQASVFDARGRQRIPDYPSSPLSEALRQSEQGLVVHLSDIKDENSRVVGYLRVISVSPQTQVLPARGGLDLVMIGAIIAVIAFIGGIYVTRAFYKLRPFITRRYQLWSRYWSGH